MSEPTPKRHLTDSDFEDISIRLGDVFHSLRAMQRFATAEFEDEMNEHFKSMVAEMSRANMKGLDACIQRLGWPPMGNFASEFDRS